MNSTIFLVSALIFVAVSAAPNSEKHEECAAKLKAAENKCKTDLKLTDADVAAWKLKPPYPDTLKNCLVKCVGEQIGVFKDGKPVEAKIMEIINKMSSPVKEKQTAIYETCKVSRGNDECETAANIYKCAMGEAVKAGLMM